MLAAAVAFAILSPLAWEFSGDYEKRLLSERRAQVLTSIAPYANGLAEALNQKVARLEGLRAFVETEKDKPAFEKEFRTFAAGLHTGARGVRTFQVLPGCVIRYNYPSAGNEKALGRNLLKDPRPEVREDVERTIASRRLTLGGPVELLQGGLAFVARHAIFDGEKFWGLVAVIFDVPPLIEEAGLTATGTQLVFGLRDHKQRVFFGDPTVFDRNPVLESVPLPEGSWDLAAVPELGWGDTLKSALLAYRLTAGSLVLLLCSLCYFAVERLARLSRAVRTREQEYGLVTEAVPALIASIDTGERYQLCNKAHQEWFGGTFGKTIREVIGQSAYDETQEHVRAALSGKRADFTFTLAHPERGLRRLSTTFVPRLDDDGRLNGFYALSVDITGRVQVDEERNGFFNLSPDLLCIGGLDGCLKMINPAWERTLGHSREELLSRPFMEFIHPDDREATKAAMVQLSSGKELQSFENRYRCKDGAYVWLLWNATVVPDQRLTYGIARDITRRKEAEDALRKSEASLERAQRMASLGNWEADSLTWDSVWSDEVYRIFGVDRANFHPSKAAFLERVYPADREALEAALLNSVITGAPFNLDYRIIRPDGTVRHVRGRAEPVRDASGAITRLIGTVQDITEYKRLEEQLHQSQKLESVGRLAGGVAHDFNNLLTVINGYAELVVQNLDANDPLYSYLVEIRTAGDRAAALTQQLLAFSRRQVLKPSMLDLNAVVAELERMMGRLIGEDIELITRFDPALGRVLADDGQIHQVLMNLVINGRDAMPDGGKLIIETANVDLPDGFSREGEKTPAGQYVMVAVSDSGIGMSDDTRAHIFEPFFTTKATGAGTGLGLSTVYGIVNQSGGRIWVYSELGKGSTFKVYLPRIVAEGAAPKKPVSPAMDLRGSETILVVEDQHEVRSLARDALKLRGYRILEAANAGEALLLCERHTGVINLMLTDVVMPGINGRELAERLKPLRPDMKVVYMSGYTDDLIVRQGNLPPGMAYIQKPFTPGSLATKVREALDSN